MAASKKSRSNKATGSGSGKAKAGKPPPKAGARKTTPAPAAPARTAPPKAGRDAPAARATASKPKESKPAIQHERPVMSTLLLYQKPVALNREAHRNLKIRAVSSFAFAAGANSVPLTGNEFAAAARQVPILFVPDANKQPTPIALLGLRRDENLFVEADGRWSGSYIPAYLRRYPFVLADKGASGEFMVALDEAYSGFGTEAGEPLFNEDGSDSAALKRAIDFLNTYLAEARRTVAFVEELKRLDLLVPQAINVTPKAGARFSVDGFFVIDEARLTRLNDEEAGKLLRSGYMGWIYMHLASIHNIAVLSARLDPRLESRKSA